MIHKTKKYMGFVRVTRLFELETLPGDESQIRERTKISNIPLYLSHISL